MSRKSAESISIYTANELLNCQTSVEFAFKLKCRINIDYIGDQYKYEGKMIKFLD